MLFSSRRRYLQQLALTSLMGMPLLGRAAHSPSGPVLPPKPAPVLSLTGLDGATQPLAILLKDRITAVQLMFTGCSATCPMQGAVFAQLQSRLTPADQAVQLLSISIDPLGDDAKAMRQWLVRFGADNARWRGALTSLKTVDPLLDFLQGRAPGVDRHTAKTYLFDRQARLAYVSSDLVAAAEVLAPLRYLLSHS